MGDLICQQRDGHEEVLGCGGNGRYGHNYCRYDPQPTSSPTIDPLSTPSPTVDPLTDMPTIGPTGDGYYETPSPTDASGPEVTVSFIHQPCAKL